jgi:hypothetical protein
MAVMALSYSRLSVFEQCPARFDYQYVSKRVQDQANEASAYGDRVHKVLEALGRTGSVIATDAETQSTLEQWGSLVESILARPGDKYFEQQMAVNNDLTPVDWFAPDVWIRAIADVLVVNGDTAYVLDWKTGKVKDNPTQLQLFALMVFWCYPQVNTVQTSFVWLKYNEVTNAKYERRYAQALWSALRPRLVRVQETVDLGVFTTKPGPLCPWCPAKEICPDARLRRR